MWDNRVISDRGFLYPRTLPNFVKTLFWQCPGLFRGRKSACKPTGRETCFSFTRSPLTNGKLPSPHLLLYWVHKDLSNHTSPFLVIESGCSCIVINSPHDVPVGGKTLSHYLHTTPSLIRTASGFDRLWYTPPHTQQDTLCRRVHAQPLTPQG